MCVSLHKYKFLAEVLYVSEGRKKDILGCTITSDANLLI